MKESITRYTVSEEIIDGDLLTAEIKVQFFKGGKQLVLYDRYDDRPVSNSTFAFAREIYNLLLDEKNRDIDFG